jgi:hypothetical protein
MLGLLIWHVMLGHPWGKHPMSNGNLIFWSIFQSKQGVRLKLADGSIVIVGSNRPDELLAVLS